MKKLIFLFIPLLTFGQNFNTKFKTDSLEYRIDSTNTLLNQFTFADCNGVNNLNVKVCEPLLTDTTINADILYMYKQGKRYTEIAAAYTSAQLDAIISAMGLAKNTSSKDKKVEYIIKNI